MIVGKQATQGDSRHTDEWPFLNRKNKTELDE